MNCHIFCEFSIGVVSRSFSSRTPFHTADIRTLSRSDGPSSRADFCCFSCRIRCHIVYTRTVLTFRAQSDYVPADWTLTRTLTGTVRKRRVDSRPAFPGEKVPRQLRASPRRTTEECVWMTTEVLGFANSNWLLVIGHWGCVLATCPFLDQSLFVPP